MGHRANYIVVDRGQTVIRYSQFGATSIPSDVLAGLAGTSKYIESLELREDLLQPAYAEGAILVDRDRQQALFYENTGNHHFNRSPGLRRLLSPFITARWRGWSIRWAEHGWFDVAEALGRPLPSLELRHPTLSTNELEERIGIVTWMFGEPIDWRSYRAAEGKLPFGHYEETIATVLTEHGGVVNDYSVVASLEQLLRIGPEALATLSGAEPAPIPNEVSAKEGVFFDLPNRVGWCWWGRPVDPRLVTAISAPWDGWTFRQHHGGLPHQLELSGRAPDEVSLQLSVAVEQLAEVFGYRAEDLPSAMRRRIDELLADGAQILHVAPTALDAGSAPDTTSIKQAVLEALCQAAPPASRRGSR